jgi:hypothetical protein
MKDVQDDLSWLRINVTLTLPVLGVIAPDSDTNEPRSGESEDDVRVIEVKGEFPSFPKT